MADKNENHNIYTIPPNFIESDTFFGGMFKVRNAIEAGVLALAVGYPVFNLDVSITARIIILCFTSLPLALLALIGVSGESLTSFIFIFFRYLKNKRVVGGTLEDTKSNLSKSVKKNDIPAQIFMKQEQNAQKKRILPLNLKS